MYKYKHQMDCKLNRFLCSSREKNELIVEKSDLGPTVWNNGPRLTLLPRPSQEERPVKLKGCGLLIARHKTIVRLTSTDPDGVEFPSRPCLVALNWRRPKHGIVL